MPATQPDRRSPARNDARREGTDLDRNYRRIGISAVAAAARYCSGAKDPTSASETQKSRKRNYEAA
jgi:hypothetical protein